MLDISHSVLVAIGIWDSIIAPNGDFRPAQLNKIPWYVYCTLVDSVFTFTLAINAYRSISVSHFRRDGVNLA